MPTETLTITRPKVSLMQRVRASMEAARSSWWGPFSTKDTGGWFGSSPVAGGVVVNAETAMAYSPFFAGVELISRDVASLPLFLYKRIQPFGKTRYLDSRLYTILHDEFNPEMSSMVARETMQAHVLTWGNAYAEIERDAAGRVVAIWPLTPDRVSVLRDYNTGAISYHVRGWNNPDVIVPASDMIHIPGLGYDGIMGYSVISKARESLGLGLAAETFGSTFFGNGATFGGVITWPGPRPTELAEKNYRESLEAKHAGPAKAHRILALYNGAKYERFGIPPNDAQFIETRKFQAEEMARWLLVPPHKIGIMDHATFSNIEQQNLDYVQTTLRAWLVRWEQELNRKVIAPLERKIQFCEHLVDGLLRGDIESRYRAYAVGRQWGWLSANDVCERENLDPLPGDQGDVYLVPANMWPADKIPDPTAKTPPAPSVEATPPAPTDQQINALTEALAKAQEQLQARADALKDLESQRQARSDVEWQKFNEAVDKAQAAVAEQTRQVVTLTLAKDDAERARVEAEAHAAANDKAHLFEKARADAAVEAEQKLGALATALREAEARAVEAAAHADEARRRAEQATATETTARQEAEALADKAWAEQAHLTQQVTTAEQERTRAMEAAAQAEAAYHDAATQLETATAAREQADAQLSTAVIAYQDEVGRTQQLQARVANLEAGLTAMQEARELAETNAAIKAAQDGEGRRLLEQATREAKQGAAEMVARVEAQLRCVRLAHRGLFVDALQRLLQREIDRARRAQVSFEKFHAWVATFYPVHADVCREALRPLVVAWVACTNQEAEADALLARIVHEHISTSVRQLEAVAQQDRDHDQFIADLDRLLRRWESTRADETADRLIREGLTS